MAKVKKMLAVLTAALVALTLMPTVALASSVSSSDPVATFTSITVADGALNLLANGDVTFGEEEVTFTPLPSGSGTPGRGGNSGYTYTNPGYNATITAAVATVDITLRLTKETIDTLLA